MPEGGRGPSDAPGPPTTAGEPTSPGDGTDAPRGPGWREVLLLAAILLAVVLLLEVASAALPPVREAFRGFPVTVVVLVVGTVGLLLLAARRRPRT